MRFEPRPDENSDMLGEQQESTSGSSTTADPDEAARRDALLENERPPEWENPLPASALSSQHDSRMDSSKISKIGTIILALAFLTIILAIIFYRSSGKRPADISNLVPTPTATLTQLPQGQPTIGIEGQSPTPYVAQVTPTVEVGAAGVSGSSPGRDGDAEMIASIDGVWQIAVEAQNCSLTIRSGEGALLTSLFHPVEQEMTAELSLDGYGIILSGRSPVLAGSQIRPPNYWPDQILIRRQSDGTFRAWTRDNVNATQWESLVVKSFTPSSYGNQYLSIKSIEGDWEFANFSQYRSKASLSFSKGSGTFKSQTLLTVYERAVARVSEQGILVTCTNPVLFGTSIPAPNFSPDKLFFRQQPDGSFKIWIKDDVNIKDWMPVVIRSYKRN